MKWLKMLSVAVSGAALKLAVEAIPAIQGTKYGPAIAVGVAMAGAYAAQSPFLQKVIEAAQGTNTPGQTDQK